jgi:large subunit ribosomal protein L30e
MTITVSQLNEVKKLLDTGKLTLGATETLKLLRQKKAAKIWISKNVRADLLGDIKHYAQLDSVEIIELPQSNEELGTLCRKPFPVSVIASTK